MNKKKTRNVNMSAKARFTRITIGARLSAIRKNQNNLTIMNILLRIAAVLVL